MILTGKCKEDFEKWMGTKDSFLFDKDDEILKLTELHEHLLNGYLIEFFDFKGININIDVIYDRASEYVRGFDSEVIFIMNGSLYINNSDCLKDDIYETRFEAVNRAIVKANEIYNHINKD